MVRKGSTKMIFDELKQIAEEEFGCTIINSSGSKTFKDIFGFDMSDINEDSEISLERVLK